MKARITLVTLGVDDLEKSMRFYRDGLGLASQGIVGKELMAQARNAGATIVKPARDTFWGGYAGYFADPDGHLWEIAWNPQWLIDE